MSNQTLTVAVVAERLCVSSDTVRRWTKSGELRGINVSIKKGGKKPRFVYRETDLEAFELLRASAAPAPPRTRGYQRPAGVIEFFKG